MKKSWETTVATQTNCATAGGTLVALVSSEKRLQLLRDVIDPGGLAMKAGDLLANSEAELASAEPNRRAINDQAMNACDSASGKLRLVVAEQFMRMNETHDRIRTELLCSPHGQGEA